MSSVAMRLSINESAGAAMRNGHGETPRRPAYRLPNSAVEIHRHLAGTLASAYPRWESYLRRKGPLALGRHPGWLSVLARGLGHTPYCLEAMQGERTVGLLPLALVESLFFGRFLVGLPYLNSGGVVADEDAIAQVLIDEAVRLADNLEVKHLELRHERVWEHAALTERVNSKVHLRLPLPADGEQLWKSFPAKVRNQVRKAEQHGIAISWGGTELLPEFYAVFSTNMRDLGTPVYGREFFRAILEQFPGQAELCVARAGPKAVAGALLLHGWGVTEVPSASSLRAYNFTNANMLMYWHLLQRALERGQSTFDFGRSTRDSNTDRFKRQWGAAATPAEWQYYPRSGSVKSARPDNPGYGRLIRIWQKLPVSVTRWIGPAIVRGIP